MSNAAEKIAVDRAPDTLRKEALFNVVTAQNLAMRFLDTEEAKTLSPEAEETFRKICIRLAAAMGSLVLMREP